MEIVCSLFGLITTLLHHSSTESSEVISQLRDFLNKVDLSKMSVDEENESQANKERPRASQNLEMPTTPRNKTSSFVALTPQNSGNLQRAEIKNVSPNLSSEAVTSSRMCMTCAKEKGKVWRWCFQTYAHLATQKQRPSSMKLLKR